LFSPNVFAVVHGRIGLPRAVGGQGNKTTGEEQKEDNYGLYVIGKDSHWSPGITCFVLCQDFFNQH
jgi:hypothetical protein